VAIVATPSPCPALLAISQTGDPTGAYTRYAYYTAAGQTSSTAGWQTRIASFKMPGC
jgi:hypothetical protein